MDRDLKKIGSLELWIYFEGLRLVGLVEGVGLGSECDLDFF